MPPIYEQNFCVFRTRFIYLLSENLKIIIDYFSSQNQPVFCNKSGADFL